MQIERVIRYTGNGVFDTIVRIIWDDDAVYEYTEQTRTPDVDWRSMERRARRAMKPLTRDDVIRLMKRSDDDVFNEI